MRAFLPSYHQNDGLPTARQVAHAVQTQLVYHLKVLGAHHGKVNQQIQSLRDIILALDKPPANHVHQYLFFTYVADLIDKQAPIFFKTFDSGVCCLHAKILKAYIAVRVQERSVIVRAAFREKNRRDGIKRADSLRTYLLRIH
jgi:hypothetical protein